MRLLKCIPYPKVLFQHALSLMMTDELGILNESFRKSTRHRKLAVVLPGKLFGGVAWNTSGDCP